MDQQLKKLAERDEFRNAVGSTVEGIAHHRRRALLILGAGIGLIVLGFGGWWYRGHQHSMRQDELRQALMVQDATIGPPANDTMKFFPTQAAKDAAVQKSFNDLTAKHSGTDEAAVAHYYLGTNASDKGNLAEAEKQFRLVVDSGNNEFGSQAKFALAQLLRSQNKTSEAEKLYRDLMANPTYFVSKEQATIELAQLIAPTNPNEARKLLEPLRTASGAVSRTALSALSNLPRQ